MTDPDVTAPEAVERWDWTNQCMKTHSHGHWVKYSDYAALSAALEAGKDDEADPSMNQTVEYVRADLCTPTDERVKPLEAENARLRIALQQIVGGEIYTAADGFSKPHEPEQSRIARNFLASLEGDKP